MIKASELRIGNYLYGKDAEPFKVDGNDLKVWDFWKDEVDGAPIKLTEEILLKCGFLKELSADNDSVYDLYKINDYEVLSSFHGTPLFFISFMNKPIIKYLHELQNLYFVLTGKELEINL